MHGINYSFPQTVTNVYLPTDFFELFKVQIGLKKGNKIYIKDVVSSSIQNEFTLPNLDLELIDDSFSNFHLQSQSNYNYYSILFERDNSLEHYSFEWYIVGKSKNSITGKLQNHILELTQSRTIHFETENIILSKSEIAKYSEDFNYQDYIQRKVGLESNDKFDNIRKEEILILLN